MLHFIIALLLSSCNKSSFIYFSSTVCILPFKTNHFSGKSASFYPLFV
nr:MAG TPA: hypothetical protein [Caudoviricetes sp.]